MVALLAEKIIDVQNDEVAVFQYMQWMSGFVSGLNYGKGNNGVVQSSNVDANSMYQNSLKNCEDEPFDDWVDAVYITHTKMYR